jgi:UDP-glucose 4-epimerase
MTPKNVILGGTGFVGGNLCQEFGVRKINYQALSSTDVDLLKLTAVNKLKKYLTRDSCLIITAAITRQKGDNLQTFADNLTIAQNIARCLQIAPVKRCIFLSTCDVYGIPEKLPITENTRINPLTYYAVSKYASERILAKVAEENKISLTILRFNGIFGPGQKNIQYGVNRFIRSILDRGIIELWGNGEELRDFVYVKDLVRIIANFVEGNSTSGVFNITSGSSITFYDLTNKIAKIVPNKFKLVYKKRTGPVFDQKFNNQKLRHIFPSFQFSDISASIRETYET